MLDQLPDWKALSREQRIEMVAPMVAEGLSSSKIAGRFRNTTRNTIIGLCHRYGMQLRGIAPKPPKQPKAPRPHGNKGQPKANAIIARAARKPPTPPPEPFDMEDGEPVDVTALVGIMQNKGCKWIHGDPLGQHGYCGKPFKAGSASWCPEHHARVFYTGHRP